MTLTKSRDAVSKETDNVVSNPLRLPDLVIHGFRGLENLHISSLGRVTMITGKNSIGKTSILDAVRVYAARGSEDAINSLLVEREEFADLFDDEGDSEPGIDLSSLFYGRHVTDGSSIVIGPSSRNNQVSIKVAEVTIDELERAIAVDPSAHIKGYNVLRAFIGNSSRDLPWFFSLDDLAVPIAYPFDKRHLLIRRRLRPKPALFEIPCTTFGPGLPNNHELADAWDKITVTDAEEVVLRSLSMVLDDDIERLAAVVESSGKERRFVVGRRGHNRQFPLKSFGDGSLRVLGMVLALTQAKEGFLLIDEAENGIHYSVQSDFWHMVLRTAHDNNVQVIATTHSYDCVRGFAQAALENEDVEGRLVQLSDRRGRLRAYELPEEELIIAAQQGIEVRG